jgi:ankyrin repeat protein
MLFQAALEGSLAGVKSAIEQGGLPNYFVRPEDQKNALHVSSEDGHLEIVKMLIENGAVINCISGLSQSSALILATQNNHVEVSSCIFISNSKYSIQ